MLISSIFQLLPEYATYMVLLWQVTPAWSKDKIVSKLLKTGQRIQQRQDWVKKNKRRPNELC